MSILIKLYALLKPTLELHNCKILRSIGLQAAAKDIEIRRYVQIRLLFASSHHSSQQEDVHLVIPNFDNDASLFAVFDGHNGIEVALYCSKYLPDYILSNKKYQNGDIVDGLKEAFLLLDNSILLKESIEELVEIRQKKHPELPLNSPGITSGCTAVVCLLKKGTFYCASIGDSRCVLCRNEQAFPLSLDNKPDEAGEQQRIIGAGGVVVQLSTSS